MRIARMIPVVLLSVTAASAASPKPVTFSVPTRDFFTSPGGAPTSVAVADLNGDGFPDAATANGATGNVSVLLANGLGGFKAAVTYAAGTDPAAIVAGDFNGDGIADLAIYTATGFGIMLGGANADLIVETSPALLQFKRG